MFSAIIISTSSQEMNTTPFNNWTTHSNSSGKASSATWQVIDQVVVFSVLTVIIAGTIFGNLLVIASIAYFTKLRTPTNAFIVSLAVADFLVGIIVMPFSMAKLVFGWYFGKAFCKIHTIMDVMLCTSSIMNLSCIAFDRFYAVCYPLKYRFRMSQKRVTVLLLICWFVPALMSFVPLLLDVHLRGLEAILLPFDPHSCVFMVNIPYAVSASVIAFYFPMLVMLVAYGKIFLVARIQARQVYTIENGLEGRNTLTRCQNSSMKKERKAAKTLGIIMGCFLICWLPFFTTNIVNPLLGYPAHHILLEVFLWLGYVNSTLNPLLYAFFNQSFRRAFYMVIGCKILASDCQNNNLSDSIRQNTQLATLSR
ncbi:5-hydroxytryptamine receptor 4-like [Rhincodon typus]|uniref:5-hydroxytryptamine receptor 4-like n=1 Tax=Rhincodon typus TaxID=259920 RepID=UPI0009A26ACE|nr:5-hydroxytryptamine receptor 4-like [Rhincodon typus]